MKWFMIEVLFAAWAFGSLLGALLAAKYERIGKMLPMAMLVGSGVVIVATVCIYFFSWG